MSAGQLSLTFRFDVREVSAALAVCTEVTCLKGVGRSVYSLLPIPLTVPLRFDMLEVDTLTHVEATTPRRIL